METYSDAAKRIANAMTLHTLAGSAGKWAAFKLQDGQTDNVAYDLRVHAVKACRWDRDRFIYLEVTPDGMQPKEAEACLTYARVLHDLGFRIPDPAFDFDASVPTFEWDKAAQAKHLATAR